MILSKIKLKTLIARFTTGFCFTISGTSKHLFFVIVHFNSVILVQSDRIYNVHNVGAFSVPAPF